MSAPQRMSLLQEFIEFLKRYGVIGMAIGIILGTKLNELVSSLVNDLLMPLIFRPALDAAQVEDIRKLSYHGVLYGKVIGSAIDFVIVAFVIFVLVRVLMRSTLPPK